ncbi:hypothetical protein Tco_0648181 [Tanacetum coccineum]
MLCYLTGMEPYYIQCIKDGLFNLKTAEGANKPDAQWAPVSQRSGSASLRDLEMQITLRPLTLPISMEETFYYGEGEVSDDGEETQVKVLMTLADDELSVRKNHARNGEWIDITMEKCKDDLLALKQAKLEAVTFQIQNTKLTKLNHALQDQLKEKRKVNENWLNSSNKSLKVKLSMSVFNSLRNLLIPSLPKSQDQNLKLLNLHQKIFRKLLQVLRSEEELLLNPLSLRHIREPIWYLDSRCSRSMTGVKSYMHKYVEQLVPEVPQSQYTNHASTSSYPVAQDRWLRDQHIELINIIGDLGEGMLTRSMAAKLTVASASECLFADFLFEIEPKKVSETLKHPGWVDVMQEELN